MNLFGTNLYSKAIQGLRQQGTINDQQTQLVYIYPIFVDDKATKYYKTISSFVSINMLKEIFIKNSLNLINIAASVHTMADDRDNSQDINLWGNNNRPKIGSPVIGKNDSYRNETQRRINEKTNEIIEILKSDPQYQKYNPYVKMITMENYVDVPVIVGTKQLNTTNSILFLFLLIALMKKIPINNESNVKSIISIIKSLQPNDFYNIVNSVKDEAQQTKSSISSIFLDLAIKTVALPITGLIKLDKKYYPSRSVYTQADKLKKFKTTISNSLNDSKYTKTTLTDSSVFNLLEHIKSNIGVFEAGWMKCFNAEKRSQEFGVPSNTNNGTKITTLISSDLNKIIEKLFTNVSNHYNSYLKSELISVASMFYSTLIASTSDPYTDVTKYISSDLLPKLDKHIFDDIHLLFLNISDNSESIIELEKKIDNLSTKINIIEDNYNDFISKNPPLINSEIFTGDTYIKEITRIRSMDTILKSYVDQFSRIFNEFFTTDIFKNIVLNFQKLINSSISSNVIGHPSEYGVNFQYFGLLERNRPGTKFSESNGKLADQFNALTELCLNYLSSFAMCIFFGDLYQAIKSYITITDVHLDLAKTEVTDESNYSLILNDDMVKVLSKTVLSYSWKQLIDSTSNKDLQKFSKFVTSNQIKKLVLYIAETLKIPNLFVISSGESPTVNYKLMHKSDILTTTMSSIEQFNTVNNKTLLGQQSQQSYYY